MNIRFYTDEDYAQYFRLIKGSNFDFPALTDRDGIRRKIEFDSESILVAVEDEKIIGVLFFSYDPRISYIWDTYVDETYRNKGIASQLFTSAQKIISSRGCKVIRGFVNGKKDDVIKFWEKRKCTHLGTLAHMQKKL